MKASISLLLITLFTVSAVPLAQGDPGRGVGRGHIARDVVCNGCVDSRDVRNNSLTGRDIRNNSLTGLDVRNGSLTNRDLRADSVMSTKLRNEAGGDGVNNEGDGRSTGLSPDPDWAVLEQVEVAHPSSGYVHCNGTGHAFIRVDDFTATIMLGWSTDGGVSVEPSGVNRLTLPLVSATANSEIPMTAMWTFPVDSMGTTTFYLKGQAVGAVVDDADYRVNAVACLFFPTRY
jgi:hypothetical protein